MVLSVNMSINMPPEMAEDVDDQAESHDMSHAEYVRFLVRQADDSPFARPEQQISSTDSKSEKGLA